MLRPWYIFAFIMLTYACSCSVSVSRKVLGLGVHKHAIRYKIISSINIFTTIIIIISALPLCKQATCRSVTKKVLRVSSINQSINQLIFIVA